MRDADGATIARRIVRVMHHEAKDCAVLCVFTFYSRGSGAAQRHIQDLQAATLYWATNVLAPRLELPLAVTDEVSREIRDLNGGCPGRVDVRCDAGSGDLVTPPSPKDAGLYTYVDGGGNGDDGVCPLALGVRVGKWSTARPVLGSWGNFQCPSHTQMRQSAC